MIRDDSKLLIEQNLELIEMNSRITYLLGMASSIIFSSNIKDESKNWFSHAIEEVIYKNQKVPDFPKDE